MKYQQIGATMQTIATNNKEIQKSIVKPKNTQKIVVGRAKT